MTEPGRHRRHWGIAVHCLLTLCLLVPVFGFTSKIHQTSCRHIRRDNTVAPVAVMAAAPKEEDHEKDATRFYHWESPIDEPSSIQNTCNDWGIHHKKDPPLPDFPHSVQHVAQAAHNAIAAALYGKQRMDPNVVQNLMMGSTLHGRRPVRNQWDAGRIGIEIDGANYLFANRGRRVTNASATRSVALLLAGKLSQRPWVGFESQGREEQTRSNRPVAVYFNTIKQALMASHELQLLRRAELEVKSHDDKHVTAYDNVTILCLGQEDDIPHSMKKDPSGTSKRRRQGRKNHHSHALATGAVDPARGILLIVQPTDFNDEYRPPGPAVGSVEALQRLVARAAVHKVATVVLSPRFLAHTPAGMYNWEQSGYQQSATYGGLEPPRGPTPWIMRDFTPPVFCWVGRALPLSNEEAFEFRDETGSTCRYAGISLIQSILQEGHSWHLFAAKECFSPLNIRSKLDYQYLASTKSSSGRPTREVLRRIFSDFGSYN